MIHLLKRRQVVSAGLAECWKFFSNPCNLSKITPPDLGFQVLSELPDEIYEGMIVEYRVRPLLGIPMTWLTEITHVRGPNYFVDEQRVGPYALWHHEHEFVEMADGRTALIDRVHYVLPFSPFSEVIHPIVVAPQLEKIFAYRVEAVEKIFGEAAPAESR
jgi:ligand-binding SRPBCC domain-containing protein